MIRLQPMRSERIDPAEEKKKARMAVINAFVTFFTLVGLIRMSPYVFQQFK